jgi:hypothetical protein
MDNIYLRFVELSHLRRRWVEGQVWKPCRESHRGYTPRNPGMGILVPFEQEGGIPLLPPWTVDAPHWELDALHWELDALHLEIDAPHWELDAHSWWRSHLFEALERTRRLRLPLQTHGSGALHWRRCLGQ